MDRFRSKHSFKVSKIKKRKLKPKFYNNRKWLKTATGPTLKNTSRQKWTTIESSSSNIEDSSENSVHEDENVASVSGKPNLYEDTDQNFWCTERSYQNEVLPSQSKKKILRRPREESSDSSPSYKEIDSDDEFFRNTVIDQEMMQEAVKAQIIKEKQGGVGVFDEVFNIPSEEEIQEEEMDEDEDRRNRIDYNSCNYEPLNNPRIIQAELTHADEEIEEDKNDYRILQDKNFSILVMGRFAEVAVVGKTMAKVLSGEAKILGYTLNPSEKKFIPLYSLKMQAHLTIQASLPESVLKNEKQVKENLIKKLQENLISVKTIEYILETVDHTSTVVLFKPISSKVTVKYTLQTCNVDFNNTVHGLSLKLDDIAYRKIVNPDYALLPVSEVRCINMMEINSVLNDILSNIHYSKTHSTTPPRILLCGPKNTGKSTIIRYLINSILDKCSKIIHLETDPGQGEFTPSGCVSMTSVEEPLLGPAFSHLKTPEAMVYVGGKTIINNPDVFCTGLWDLMIHYKKVCPNFPLFINTMGWTTDMGRSLLIDVIRYTDPTFVIQLNLTENNPSDNLPNLYSGFVNKASGWKTNIGEVKLGYELRVLSLKAQEQTFFRSPLANASSQKKFRELSSFAYWGKLQSTGCVDSFEPINSFTPFKIPFKSIGVHFCNDSPPHSHLLEALNVSLVALCHLDKKQMERDAEFPHYPKKINSIEGNVHLGYGIIRGIDIKEETIYIITPEPLQRLQVVNALVVGYDDFPVTLLTTQNVNGSIPFMAKPTSLNASLSKGINTKRRKSKIKGRRWARVV